jgi:hypothetical protein
MPVPAEVQAKIDEVREHVGSTPDELAIIDALDRSEDNVLRAALRILRIRRADLISGPGRLSVDQDYSREITKTQLDALDRQIAEVLRLIDLEDGTLGDEDDSALPAVSTARLDPDDRVREDEAYWADIPVRW